MDARQMRIEVAKAYPGPGWQKKVQRMSDAQIIAIYLKFQKDKNRK